MTEEFMNWYREVLQKYATFTGRARRAEFWWFILINFLITAVIGAFERMIGISEGSNPGFISSLYSLAVLLPSIAVGVRRLHDTGRSGWWLLLAVVPIANIALLVFLILEGVAGPNAYGPDPKLGASSLQQVSQVAASWLADPSGRHELRYWDGTRWTEHVSDKGVTSVDPV